MKTAYGKLMALAFLLLAGIMLLAPMRAGNEDILTLSAYSASLNPGESLVIGYRLQTETAQTVAYSSDDPAVAAVDQRGVITGIAPGETYVRLRAERGAGAEVKVHVSGTPITRFMLNTNALSMKKGEISGLSCIFNDGATDQRVEWFSANPDIALVDSAGRVTAVGAGNTYIVATTPSGHSAACAVHVLVSATTLHIVPGDLTVGVGATLQLGASYLPEDSTDTIVSWRSNHPEILTVSETGMVRAVSVGSATVTAVSSNGIVGATTINVERAAKHFQINPVNIALERGTNYTLQSWFLDSAGNRADEIKHHVEWKSSNPSVATVENGTITAVSSGLAFITASADGFSSQCAVHVVTNVQEITLNMAELYLLPSQTGEPFQLQAYLTPADADDRTVTYTTDNPPVATVSKDGLVTMTGGYGTAIITCTSASGAQATFAVHVVPKLPDGQTVPAVAAE